MKKFLVFLFILTLGWASVYQSDSLIGGLSWDGAFWGSAGIGQEWKRGWGKVKFEFQQLGGFLGLSKKLSEHALARIEVDVGRMSLRDLFVDFSWESGIGLRAGQFKMPLSFECETREDELKFINYSILSDSNLVKLGNQRDIGLTVSYSRRDDDGERFRATGMVVSGAGPNVPDNNSQKDVSVRVVVKPWKQVNLLFAARGYYGWFESWGIGWSGVAGEVAFEQKFFSLQGEFLHRRYQNKGVPAGYCQIAGEFGFIEPAVRLELVRWSAEESEWVVGSGIGLAPIPNRVKVFIGYQYHNCGVSRRSQELAVKLLTVL